MNFTVQGKLFMPMGGQACNSSAYNAEELASAIAGVLALGGNTLIAPLYWDQVEPEEGRFDFTPLDMMLAECRLNNLRLIVLWFATWKNGEMRYVPGWVKSDPTRFRRVLRPDGAPMQVLSSYCRESQEADARAFAAVMAHLKAADGEQGTVIAVQVQNEPGILGSDRDYTPEGEAALRGSVPAALVAYLQKRGEGETWRIWQEHGGSTRGSWTDLFGLHGGEFCTAWSVAKYIDAVAAAGKQAYDLPLYVNVWLGYPGWGVPGFYPSGGAVWRTIDVWKCAATHIDGIAPDIYVANFNDYKTVCRQYTRPDNPLFVPESSPDGINARNMLRAIADFDATGYFCFGIDSVLDLEGNVTEAARPFIASFRGVMALLPLVQKYRGTGCIHAVVEEDHQSGQSFEFERYLGAVPFSDMGAHSHRKDHRHDRSPQRTEGLPKFGLIIEAGAHELYLAGNFNLFLVAKESPQWIDVIKSPSGFTPVDFLTVEEGYLTADGEFVPTRTRNGDEAIFGGFWATTYSGVVRVRLAVAG